MMKRPILKLFCFSILSAVLILIFGMWYANRLNPPLVSIEWKELDSIEPIDSKIYQLRHFYKIHSNYIYCEFQQRIDPNNTDLNKQTVKAFLIDCKKQKCVLQAKWQNISTSKNYIFRKVYTSNGLFMENGQPVLFLTYRKANLPKRGRRHNDPSLKKVYYTIFPPTKIVHRLYFPDRIKTLSNYITLNNWENSFDNLLITTKRNINKTILYEFKNSTLEKQIEWNEKNSPLYFRSISPNKFLGIDSYNNSIVVYHGKPSPNVENVDVQSIFEFKHQPQEQLMNMQNPISEIVLTPIHSAKKSEAFISAFCLFDTKTDIYQLVLGSSNGKSTESILKHHGSFKYPPAMILHQNRVLIFFHQFSNEVMAPIFSSRDFLYTQRSQNADGTYTPFQSQIEHVFFTQPPQAISSQPFDGEHLLFYRDNAFWTIRWDGSEEHRIFPATDVHSHSNETPYAKPSHPHIKGQ